MRGGGDTPVRRRGDGVLDVLGDEELGVEVWRTLVAVRAGVLRGVMGGGGRGHVKESGQTSGADRLGRESAVGARGDSLSLSLTTRRVTGPLLEPLRMHYKLAISSSLPCAPPNPLSRVRRRKRVMRDRHLPPGSTPAHPRSIALVPGHPPALSHRCPVLARPRSQCSPHQ